MAVEDLSMVAGAADIVLSALHLAFYATILPFYSDLFGICTSGNPETWTDKRLGTGYLAHFKMQSVGWVRLRSCSVGFANDFMTPLIPY